MDLYVVGCHGGETPHHRTSAFVIDERLAVDAGSLTAGLELRAQCRLEACLVSHAHLDHIRDLATIADNRAQKECPPLIVAATKPTVSLLRRHFFNDAIWPDFTKIPSETQPTIRYLVLHPERPCRLLDYRIRAVPVSHTVDCSAFIIEGPRGTIAYSGDTGPTDRLWDVLNATENLRALLLEVSFANEAQTLATLSGHHTPNTLSADLRKFRDPSRLPTFLHHIKPAYQSAVERECARISDLDLTVLSLGDQYRF